MVREYKLYSLLGSIFMRDNIQGMSLRESYCFQSSNGLSQPPSTICEHLGISRRTNRPWTSIKFGAPKAHSNREDHVPTKIIVPVLAGANNQKDLKEFLSHFAFPRENFLKLERCSFSYGGRKIRNKR